MLLVIGLSACTANNNKEESVKACKTGICKLFYINYLCVKR